MMPISASRFARKCLPGGSLGALFLLGLTGLLAACGGGGSSSTNTTPPTTATLTSIAVTASPASVGVGATSQFTAVGTYSDSTTKTLTTTATWTSATTSVATITSSGLATSLAVGTSVITATSGGVSGTATLTVTSATVATIAVTPATASIAPGATQTFVATATFTDGTSRILTSATTPAVAWTSGTTANATIGATSGVATGVTAGTSVITATASSITGTATLTISTATLASIAVAPAPPSVISGSTRQLNILATFSDASTATVAGSSGTWSSSATGVATIGTNTGIATGVATGTSTVSVSYNGQNATATLTVTPAEYAYVTNFGENTVSTFSVGPGGSLVATGTPIATGVQPFALAPDVTGHYLYVGNYNKKATGSISEYTIGAGGVLTALGNVATGAGPNGMAVNNGYVYVANLGDSTVAWYAINGTTGQLSTLTSSTQVVSGSAGAGAAAVNFNTITAGTFAYVSNFSANTISIFTVNSTTGALTALTGSGATVTLPSGSTGPVEVAFDKTGKYAYVVDFTSGDIAQYTVNADGSLTVFATSPVIALGGNPRWITLDTTSNTAYVPNAGTNAIQVLSVGTAGVLTLTASEPLAANSTGVAANPSYVALDQTGTLLYAAERGGTNTGLAPPYNNLMAQFSVDDTGALSPLATATVATGTTATSEPAEIAFSLAY